MDHAPATRNYFNFYASSCCATDGLPYRELGTASAYKSLVCCKTRRITGIAALFNLNQLYNAPKVSIHGRTNTILLQFYSPAAEHGKNN